MELQLEKALLPIVVTLAGIDTLVREEQPEKALVLIDVTGSPKYCEGRTSSPEIKGSTPAIV